MLGFSPLSSLPLSSVEQSEAGNYANIVLEAFTADATGFVSDIGTVTGVANITLQEFSSTALGSAITAISGSTGATLAAFTVSGTGTALPDTSPPVIVVTGPNPTILAIGDPYVELGATWVDNVDGTGPAVVGGDTVDINTAGVYVVTYDYTDSNGNVGVQQTRTVIVSDVAIGSEQRSLNLHDFPASIYPRVNDIQIPLIRLKRLVRRASPAVARQIENYIYNTYLQVRVTNVEGTPPDATAPSTVNLKILYSIFVDYLRAERIKVLHLLDTSNNSTIRHSMSRQLQLWLETQGWQFFFPA